GAPFDIPLLDGGTRPLLHRTGNWLVMRAGRRVLIIEQHGKRLTALATASLEDLAAAVECLSNVLRREGHHHWTVAASHAQPSAAGAGRDLLYMAGFVRASQAITLHSAWQ